MTGANHWLTHFMQMVLSNQRKLGNQRKYELFLTQLVKKCQLIKICFSVQIFDKIAENARFVLQIDNARLAADDFKVKYVVLSLFSQSCLLPPLHDTVLIDSVSVHPHRFDNEMAIRQSVEVDIAGLKKVIDDTNMTRMNIESEIEAVREELAYLMKNHENVS